MGANSASRPGQPSSPQRPARSALSRGMPRGFRPLPARSQPRPDSFLYQTPLRLPGSFLDTHEYLYRLMSDLAQHKSTVSHNAALPKEGSGVVIPIRCTDVARKATEDLRWQGGSEVSLNTPSSHLVSTGYTPSSWHAPDMSTAGHSERLQ